MNDTLFLAGGFQLTVHQQQQHHADRVQPGAVEYNGDGLWVPGQLPHVTATAAGGG